MTTNAAEDLFQAILDETVRLVNAVPQIKEFVPDQGFNDLIPQPLVPQWLEAANQVPDLLGQTNDVTMPLVETIVNARHALHWKQSYKAHDGFDDDYLRQYAFFDLVSDTGPFFEPSMRVSVGYWGEGLFYKRHWHEPEELYVVLAGGARFISEGSRDRICRPGDTVYHASNQPHAIDMSHSPLLVIAFWRGNNLYAKSTVPKDAPS